MKSKKLLKHDYALIINDFMPLIVKIAGEHSYLLPKDEFQDIVDEGVLGLLEAIKRYNPKKSKKFSTYAYYWIKKFILRYINASISIIKFPQHLRRKIKDLKKHLDKSDIELNDEENTEESQHRYLKEPLIETVPQVLSINDNDWDSEIEDNVDPFSHIKQSYYIDRLKKILETLPELEYRIVCLRFGLENNKPLPLKEVAKKVKLPVYMIKDLETTILEKLKELIKE